MKSELFSASSVILSLGMVVSLFLLSFNSKVESLMFVEAFSTLFEAEEEPCSADGMVLLSGIVGADIFGASIAGAL